MLKFCVRAIFPLAFGMTLFGILVLSYAGKAQAAGASHFFFQQSVFFAVALVGGFLLSRIDYHHYRAPWLLWTIVGIMLLSLVLVLTPGIGKAVKGSHRWIGIGGFSIQPIEFVKVMMIVFLAGYLDKLGGLINRWWQGVFIPVGVIAAVLGLTVLQPDFGGATIVCFLAGVCLLVGGMGYKKCIVLALIGVAAIAVLVMSNENRMRRLSNESQGANYQAQQAEIAFNNGHIFGAGLGSGMQKERYLPECHTDFILAIIGEDLGIVATASIWCAFMLFFFCGLVVSFSAQDKQGMLLAFGATLMISAQAAANMAVVTHLFPTKGLALPFFSYGGSCLLATFAAVGLLTAVGNSTLVGLETAEQQRAKRLVSF